MILEIPSGRLQQHHETLGASFALLKKELGKYRVVQI
jgi:hypothetical protein